MWVKLIVTSETWFKADLPSSFFPRGYPILTVVLIHLDTFPMHLYIPV